MRRSICRDVLWWAILPPCAVPRSALPGRDSPACPWRRWPIRPRRCKLRHAAFGVGIARFAGTCGFGAISADAGRAAAQCVEWAARAALRGEVAGLVTAPLHKESLHAAGVPYPGHTELLQAEAAAHRGVALADMPVRMMLASDELRTVLVSIHMSMRAALDAVTFENILQTLHHPRSPFAQPAPCTAHRGGRAEPACGRGGLFGREEIEVITPAIEAARAQGLGVTGPLAPDTVFMRARHTQARPGEFDVVLAMYHDQGLIPVKYLGVDKGVNVTLGLPLVRTSPDHGTAFDIAGQVWQMPPV